MRVRDLLRIPSFYGVEVVAGSSGLDRAVSWVHVSELLDIARLLSGNEFLLTTGMTLAHVSRDEQLTYVQRLDSAGIAGIGIELVQ